MDNFTDEQRWVYPHWHPWFNQNPHRRFMPFPGRPMGDESYRHATIISIMGRGPKGPKGDTFAYEDLTESDIANLANHFGKVLISRKNKEFDIDSTNNKRLDVSSMGIDPVNSFIYVYINGLMTYDFLFETVEGVDYIVFYPNSENTFITVDEGMSNHVEVEVLSATVDDSPQEPVE